VSELRSKNEPVSIDQAYAGICRRRSGVEPIGQRLGGEDVYPTTCSCLSYAQQRASTAQIGETYEGMCRRGCALATIRPATQRIGLTAMLPEQLLMSELRSTVSY